MQKRKVEGKALEDQYLQCPIESSDVKKNSGDQRSAAEFQVGQSKFLGQTRSKAMQQARGRLCQTSSPVPQLLKATQTKI